MDCFFDGCLRPVFRAGLCYSHYDERRMADKPPCSVVGCGTRSRSAGFCQKHYREQLRAVAPHCSIEGCERAAVAGGLCDTHRKRRDRRGSLDPTRAHDWGGRRAHPFYQTWMWLRRRAGYVPVSEEWQKDFWRFVDDMGDKPPGHVLRRKDNSLPYQKGNVHWTKKKISVSDAASRKEYMRVWHKRYREENPDRFRHYQMKSLRGIGLEDFNVMLAAQGGVCAICEKQESASHPITGAPRSLAVDHCHSTGKIRGLLCSRCNSILGHALDDVEILRRAIAYLGRSGVSES